MYRIIGTDGQQYGPVTPEQVRRWLAENRVNAHTLAQQEGTQEWKPLASFPEFADDFKALPPLTSAVPPVASAASSKASSKIPAGICGILLGSFGIHKFILGYTGAGLIMLLVTVLTCFVAAPVMHIIGLIEGILYLAKSDEEFVRTYVDNRREWF
ncbi:MAG TPA: GYF domain-containing protein [Clostridia bacterium]|nr:GYF domain-containing protein [Clostridia bacterium]